MQNFKIFSVVLLLGYMIIFGACTPKITNPKIESLEAREALLALNTRLNDLNLALEREREKIIDLSQKVNKANQTASNSAAKSQVLSEDLSNHAGDAKLAIKALRASKKAKRDAKIAEKANVKLSDSNHRISLYQKDIEETKQKIADLDSKIQFTPNQ
jgi:chromosome segregation ATPase